MSWSPGGQLLAVADRKSLNDPLSLCLVETDGGQKIQLATPSGADSQDQTPVFSPDGRMLLFTRCHKLFLCGLYLLDLSAAYRPTGRARPLREETGAIQGAAWTVNGKEVIYTSSNSGGLNPHLMKIRVESGAQPEYLTYAGENVYDLAIAPRGNRVAYAQDLTDVDLWQVRAGKFSAEFRVLQAI